MLLQEESDNEKKAKILLHFLNVTTKKNYITSVTNYKKLCYGVFKAFKAEI